MLKTNEKLAVMNSNLYALKLLAAELVEKINCASETAPEEYSDEQKCNFLMGGFCGAEDLIANLQSLALAMQVIHQINR